MQRLHDAEAAAREIVARTGGEIRLALPLGLGKPVRLVNALVKLACDDPSIRLAIFTALTLEPPDPGSGMKARFLGPAKDRLFGAYPALLYAELLRRDALPDNITVNEFFLLAGRWLGVAPMQQAYISANYTHARDVLIAQEPNVLAQLVSEQDGSFSLSGNTDISADLFAMRAEGKLDFVAVGEVHPDLPFMQGPGAVLTPEAFHLTLVPEPYELFSAVKRPVDAAAHAIGLHVSRLIADGGTLQIGIGAIGDAVAHALLLRHSGAAPPIQRAAPFDLPAPGGPFEEGLHGVTEMLVGGLLALFEAGVVRREVDGHAIAAGFFVDTRDFYRRLREMPREERARIAMTPVSFTNALYGNEAEKRTARVKARFVNGAMQVSVMGDVMSDTVENGQVVSGVGGQFNFVEQAFALHDARSIITLPATRWSEGKRHSNIRWSVATTTVPRHMRDVVVTEYGIADLRGRSDAETIAALIAIADSAFQDELIDRAQKAGKLPKGFTLPQSARNNWPEAVETWLAPHRAELPDFPFGSDFDEIERLLLPALEELSRHTPTLRGKARLLRDALRLPPHPREQEALARMGFDSRYAGGEALALSGALRRVVT